jgi:hypothetical protein
MVMEKRARAAGSVGEEWRRSAEAPLRRWVAPRFQPSICHDKTMSHLQHKLVLPSRGPGSSVSSIGTAHVSLPTSALNPWPCFGFRPGWMRAYSGRIQMLRKRTGQSWLLKSGLDVRLAQNSLRTMNSETGRTPILRRLRKFKTPLLIGFQVSRAR